MFRATYNYSSPTISWHRICINVLVRAYYGGRLEIQIDKKGERVDPLQRRRSPRIRLQVPVFLRGVDTSGVEFIELTKTLNISATGACIASAHFLRPDQVVSITVPAPSPTSSSSVVPNETPPISAKIIRQSLAGDLRLFALEFLRPLE
jgi:PilZ domain